MSQTQTIKYLSYSEVCLGNKKSVTFSCSAFEIFKLLKTNGIPFTPNVRKPKANKVTESIEAGIKKANENKESYNIPSPIYLSAHTCEKNGECLYITFNTLDGVMDGGHRIEAIRLCVLHSVNIDNVVMNFIVYVNYEPEEIKEASLRLNLSKNPTIKTINNHLGKFDELKEIVDTGSTQVRLTYYENEYYLPRNVNDLTDALKIVKYVNSLDPTYSPANPSLGGTRSKKHPTFLVNKSYVDDLHVSKYKGKDVSKLVESVILIQELIVKEVSMYASRTKNNLPFVVSNNEKKYTILPNLDINNNWQKIFISFPYGVYVMPLMSAFRACLNYTEPEWLIEGEQEQKKFFNLVIPIMVRELVNILRKPKYVDKTARALLDDIYIWDCMYDVVKKQMLISYQLEPPNITLIKMLEAKENKFINKIKDVQEINN